MNALVLHVLNNPTIGCSVIELKGEVITSAYLDQGTESDFEVACERAIMSLPGQCTWAQLCGIKGAQKLGPKEVEVRTNYDRVS